MKLNAAIVEDDEWIREGITMLLKRTDGDFSSIETFSCVGQAMARFEEQPFDMLLTDIEMPKENGLSLIQALRTQYPLLPCIIITGYDRFDYARRGLQIGAADYLLKPVDEAELSRAVGRVKTALCERAFNKSRYHAWMNLLSAATAQGMSQLLVHLREQARETGMLSADIRDFILAASALLQRETLPDDGLWKQWDTLIAFASEQKSVSGLADEIREYIVQNCEKDLTVACIAEHFYISPAYLGQIYIKAYQHPINTALHWARIERAKKLLRETACSIAEVASSCGYKTVDHFYRQFRRFENQTPAAYRDHWQSSDPA